MLNFDKALMVSVNSRISTVKVYGASSVHWHLKSDRLKVLGRPFGLQIAWNPSAKRSNTIGDRFARRIGLSDGELNVHGTFLICHALDDGELFGMGNTELSLAMRWLGDALFEQGGVDLGIDWDDEMAEVL